METFVQTKTADLNKYSHEIALISKIVEMPLAEVTEAIFDFINNKGMRHQEIPAFATFVVKYGSLPASLGEFRTRDDRAYLKFYKP